MKCSICSSEQVVFSGTDAFVLGIPTEKYCYECANNGSAKRAEALKGLSEWEIEEQYKEMLDECYPAYNFNGMEYLPSAILRNCDPIAYRIGLSEFTDVLLEEQEIG